MAPQEKQKNIKQNKNLYETVYPTGYVAFVEVDFHDVPEVARWLLDHTTECGEAIAHAICGICEVAYVAPSNPVEPEPTPAEQDIRYRVQVGSFKNHTNAII